MIGISHLKKILHTALVAALAIIGSNVKAESGKVSIQPHMSLENCFRCHVDARDIAVNPSGDIAVHYGATNKPAEVPGGRLLCVDCHTTLISVEEYKKHIANDDSRPIRLPKIECHDCHGTLEQRPKEEKAETDTEGGVKVLRSDGTPFGNIVKQDQKVILTSVTSKKIEVTILKDKRINNTWSSELSRQTKQQSQHNNELNCIDCHSDWAPTCYGCHK